MVLSGAVGIGYVEAWKRACKAYKEINFADDFRRRFEDLKIQFGDPNAPQPQGTIFADQDTEVAKAARRGFNS